MIIYSKRYDTRQIWYSRRSVHSEFWIELETKHWFSSSLRFFLPPFPIFPVPNDTSTPRRVPLLLPRAVPTAFQHSSGLKTMTQAGSGQLGQRWRHNCAMFNSKLQETIKRATPVGVMGADVTWQRRAEIIHWAGEPAHSSSLDAPGPLGPLSITHRVQLWLEGTVGGRGRCNSTSAMLLRVLEPRSPVPHFNEIRPPFRRRNRTRCSPRSSIMFFRCNRM